MSAPKTNLDTQKRRHIGPLIGIVLSLVFVGGLILWWQYQATAENQARQSQPEDVQDAPPAVPPTGSD